MKLLFVEPPKDYGLLWESICHRRMGFFNLAAYVEKEIKDIEIEVIDCNAQQVDWKGLERRIESFNPNVVASSAFATCNAYVVARTLETAKRINPKYSNSYWWSTFYSHSPRKPRNVS